MNLMSVQTKENLSIRSLLGDRIRNCQSRFLGAVLSVCRRTVATKGGRLALQNGNERKSMSAKLLEPIRHSPPDNEEATTRVVVRYLARRSRGRLTG